MEFGMERRLARGVPGRFHKHKSQAAIRPQIFPT